MSEEETARAGPGDGARLLMFGAAVAVITASFGLAVHLGVEQPALGVLAGIVSVLATLVAARLLLHSTVSASSRDDADNDDTTRSPPDESRQLLPTILDGMTEGVVVTDTEGLVLLVNPAARRLLGLGKRTRVAGRHLLEVYRSPLLGDAMDEAMNGGQPINRELVLRRQETLYVAVAVAPVKQEGTISGAVAVLHDITKIRQLERIRRDFVANVSHELRTPLATISGYAETLLSGAVELDPTARDFVETIERHARRLTEMVKDLLVLARYEAEGERPTLGAIHLAHVAEDVLDAVSEAADQAGIEVRLVGLDALPEAIAEERALHQVVRNLVENAIKYTESPGVVTVEGHLDTDNSRVELHVVDTGIGIEPVHLPRIFERFYRVDEGRSRDEGGSGLGLAIVKHLVISMNGEIEVQSTPGHGSRFILGFDSAEPLDDELEATDEWSTLPTMSSRSVEVAS